MKMNLFAFACVIALAMQVFASSNGAWLTKVPAKEHEKTNPFRDQADAVAAGQRVYKDHCSHCHGDNQQGNKKHPQLRSARVQREATEGDLHWLLVNGSMGHGMPSWSKLGDPQIWQLVSFLKSLN